MKTKTRELNLENASEIPGLTLRGYRSEEDLPGMLETWKAAMKSDGLDAAETLEEMIYNYNHLERCDVYKDLVIAEFEGEIIAYGRTWWDAEPKGDHLYGFFVNLRPEWRGKGVGTQMAERLISRAREIAEEHPADAPKFLQSWSEDRQVWQNGLLEKLGLAPVRFIFEMTRSCSKPVEVLPLPEGIELRPITPDLMRAVFDAETEAFRDHWGFVEPTEKSYQAWLNWPLQAPELWKVAFDGDQVVGMVRNFINHKHNQEANRKRGYTENISVRRPWRRQGIARALLSQSIQMFIEMGMEETFLGVDTENPSGAMALYTDVGYEKTHAIGVYRRPL
jgi:ribosomal protein S18 acetylase RimI-like enzyme